jgi:hypothetical protein
MSDDRLSLQAAVERLEAATTRLAQDGIDPEELKRLAEQALTASAEITERLPRVIRDIERTAEGSGPAAP